MNTTIIIMAAILLASLGIVSGMAAGNLYNTDQQGFRVGAFFTVSMIAAAMALAFVAGRP